MPSIRLACLALIMALAPRPAGAQDSLRVLRFGPASPASLAEPVVVAFDHPVAPRLDASVNPSSAITITPAGGSSARWQDPSTLVVSFDATRPRSASYLVKLDPALRSADGLALSRRDTATRRINVRSLQVLLVETGRADGLLDTLAHMRVVVASQEDTEWATIRAALLPACPSDAGATVGLRLERVHSIGVGDSYAMREAGGGDRDRRADSLRRVLELVADRPLPRGCRARFELRRGTAEPPVVVRDLVVQPPFALLPRACGGDRACPPPRFFIAFNEPVWAHEIRAHVRIDGEPPSIDGDSMSTRWRIHGGLKAGTEHTLTVSRALRGTSGDSLGTDVIERFHVPHVEAAVAYATGSFVQPRRAPTLLGIRHVSVDSVYVVVARVRDSALTAALSHTPWSGQRWRAVAGDSIVLRYAAPGIDDSSSVLTIPSADLPAAWRDATPLAIRVDGVPRQWPAAVPPPTPTEGRVPAPVFGRTEPVEAFVVLRRSDIALHTLDALGELRVWVTSLATERPLAGARVRLMNGARRELVRGVSGPSGLVVLRYAPTSDTSARARSLFVEARHEDDVNLQAVAARWMPPRSARVADDDEDDGGDSDAAAIRSLQWQSLTRLHGAAFTERGIYRPGERVFLKGVARLYDARTGYTTPRGDSARWVVRWTESWRHERVWTHRVRLGELGTAVDTFTVPRTARLGQYEAELTVRRNGSWWLASSTTFAVAEYRVPEFTAAATADTMVPRFARDTATVQIDARYFFGLPMQDARVEWWADTRESSPWEVRVRGLAGLNIGRSWWLLPEGLNRAASSSERGQLVTDAEGRTYARVPLGALSRPGRMTLNATVTDASRQTVTTQLSLPVHAADVYIGARLARSRWVWGAGEPIPVEALVVGADGTRRPGVKVELMAIRYDWGNGRRADTVWRDARVFTGDTLRVAFTPDKPGQYELVLAARDAQGRQSATGVYAWVASADSRVAHTSAGLTLGADKPRYQPGDRATVRVEAAEPGAAWVTVAHEGILWETTVDLRRGVNMITVPIPADAPPAVALTVLALRPRLSADSSDVRYVRRTIYLEVGREANVLHVAVVPDRTRYQPRDTVRLALAVTDATGRGVRGELAVWAVDEGVASLTAMEAPDLLTSLLASSGIPQVFVTTLAMMFPRVVPLTLPGRMVMLRGAASAASRRIPVRMDVPAPGTNMLSQVVTTGTGAQAPDATLRELFATTPLYRGAIMSDANGRARVEFGLPDNLTTFRLIAVAIADGARAGSGDTSIVSTRTLAVRPALPRVIRDGDSVFAGAVITQDRGGRAPVTLRVEGTDVGITGATVQTDVLDGRQPRELRFALRGIASDTAVLRFRGSTALDADAVEARLPVSPAGHARTRVVMGTLAGSAQPAFRVDEPLDAGRSRLELQVGSSPLPLLHQLSESLRLYPYFCTEQMASAGRAAVARIRAERLVRPAGALSARDRAQLEMGVATIVARQREDGGFGYWSSTNWTSPWLTSYALEFLDGARSLGIDVPAGALMRAGEYLSESGPLAKVVHYRRPIPGAPADSVHALDALAAVLALRAIQHPDSALEERVLRSAAEFGWVDRLSLARLLVLRGDQSGARAIVAEAWRATKVEGRRIVVDDSVLPREWLFRSVMRPVASLLITAAAVTPDDPRLDPLFESLLQVGQSNARGWGWNTIDQALVVDAVAAMLQRRAPGDSTLVTVTGRDPSTRYGTLVAGLGRSDSLRMTVRQLASSAAVGDSIGLGLRADPARPVYYAAMLHEVPTARPVRAADDGISVERWYERYDDPRPIVEVRAGELVRVRIRVTVPADREFVVIDDALPAGLEAVDLSLRTSGALPPFAGAPRIAAEEHAEGSLGQRYAYGSWDGGWWVPWEHREIRDDRVLYFARQLWKGSYLISYVARATTAGSFVRPPTHAEEMYNPALYGRSDGGTFTVTP